MSMFVDRLMEALAPAHRISQPGDDLVVDVPRFRALLMSELRSRQQQDTLLRQDPLAASIAVWVKDGWLDDHLHGIADSLIEMGVVRDQALLDHFLQAAVLDRLGIHTFLSPTDRLLLDLAGRPAAPGCEELDVRLLARRYARQLDLIAVPEGDRKSRELTELGHAVSRLPKELVLPFLVTLEGLSSYGNADPWRAPQRAYHLLYERGQVVLLRGEEQRQRMDPEGLWRFLRLRRFTRMGLCEGQPPPTESPEGPESPGSPGSIEYAVRLTPTGRRALHEALRTPPSEVALLCEQLYRRSRHQALSTLSPRQSLLRDTGTVLPLLRASSPSPSPAPPPISLDCPPQAVRLTTLDEVLGARLQPELFGSSLGPAPPRETPGPLAPEPPFSLEALCREAVRDVQGSPRFRRVTLSLSVQAGVPREHLLLFAGRRPLRLLVLELLSAASSAVVGQSVQRVLIELSATETELVFWLSDNGPGIPVSQRPLVFAETVLPGQPQPRYLLGAVRRLVEEQFRGRIEIAAPRLGGASFRVTFPRPQKNQRQAAA